MRVYILLFTMPHDTHIQNLRSAIRVATLAEETSVLTSLIAKVDLSPDERQTIAAQAVKLVETVRSSTTPNIVESFLSEYGLNTTEGIALMCLAEALLRVPNAETIDALISDKIVPSHWGQHLGHSGSSLINASTWAWILTGKG